MPGADAYYPVEMGKLTEDLKINKQTYIVITSRGSAVDAKGLPTLLESNPAYIGVIGSRRRWLTTVKALKEKGVSGGKDRESPFPNGTRVERGNARGNRGQHHGGDSDDQG